MAGGADVASVAGLESDCAGVVVVAVAAAVSGAVVGGGPAFAAVSVGGVLGWAFADDDDERDGPSSLASTAGSDSAIFALLDAV